MPALPADAQAALAQLDALAESYPDLAALVAAQQALISVTWREPAPSVPVSLAPATAIARLQGGVPLLRNEQLAIDPRWLHNRWHALTDALSRSEATTDEQRARRAAMLQLQRAADRHDLDLFALAHLILSGNVNVVVERADALDLDAGLAATLLRWTLLPVLEQIAMNFAPIRADVPWNHGFCPTCGAWPMLAEQRGIEQRRFLRCGLCATAWSAERLHCPFCSSRDFHDSGYLFDEASEANERAVTCERCHGYYKLISTLTPLSTPALFAYDLATIHLDLIALERAYAPPA